jgi:NAD(P)H-hydrate epimerase
MMPVAVRADVTVTFIGRKQGLYTGDAAACRGRLLFAGLGVPEQIYQSQPPSARLIEPQGYGHLLQRRSRTAHKGDFGHVLVIGGEYGYAGAACLCAQAAARAGAGLVTVATRPAHAAVLSMARSELMAAGVDRAEDLEPLLTRATVAAIGPGLGQSSWSREMLTRVATAGLPMVADADALNLLARDPIRRDDWILTPHPGEAARLLGCTASDIQKDRFAAARQLYIKYGGTIILKGSGTIVTDRAGRQYICPDGNPGMASGGMGDVLTGLIAGFVAQGIDHDEAAKMGVSIHARAADREAAAQGERGMLAADLLPGIRQLINP